MTVNSAKLAALEQLLARPDEPSLRSGQPFSIFPRVLARVGFEPIGGGRPRGHHLTQPGAADRLTTTWLSIVDVWTAERIAASVGPLEGWKFRGRRHGWRLVRASS